MIIQPLGTSSGTPTRARNVSACALSESTGKRWVLIDCGEGTQHQLLRTRLSLNALSAVCITHIHGDHCYGLPGLLGSAAMNGRTAPLTIVAPAGIREWLQAAQVHTDLQLPFEIEFIATETLTDLQVGHLSVSATPLSHRVPSFAYRFAETRVVRHLDADKLAAFGVPRGPLWGQLQSGQDVELEGRIIRADAVIQTPAPPRTVVISGDNDQPEVLAEACRDAHVLVHEATFSEQHADKAFAYGHSTAQQVAAFAEHSRLPNLILTHFSPRYAPEQGTSPSLSDLRAEAQAVYSGQLFLAEDLNRYQLDASGQLSLLEES